MVIYTLVPKKEQDELGKGFLKTKSECYVWLPSVTYQIKGEEEKRFASEKQDKLEKDGLLRFTDGSYHSLDSIEEIEKNECFVATTVYGNRNAPEVRKLRKFRDEKLKQNLFGRAFVNVYYSGAGKKTGSLLKNRLPYVIPPLRKGLDLFTERLEDIVD